MELQVVKVVSKYLNGSTVSKVLLPVLDVVILSSMGVGASESTVRVCMQFLLRTIITLLVGLTENKLPLALSL
jgi:hypothetical protein